jgi:hypothetical protein
MAGAVFIVILAKFQAFFDDFRLHWPDKIYDFSGVAQDI